MPMLEDAILLAVQAHCGQRDKNGQPYILHPLRVMLRLESDEERIVGVLHDVIEDTKYTRQDLEKIGYSDSILEALDCVTKREGESYEDFVLRAKANPIAKRVKLADLEDNMDVRRLPEIGSKDIERLTRVPQGVVGAQRRSAMKRSATAVTESEILSRAMETIDAKEWDQVAHLISKLRLPERDLDRVDELLAKKRRGAISQQEIGELEKYLRVGISSISSEHELCVAVSLG